jgi:hypothetical protein
MDYVLEPAKLVEVIMTKFYKKDFVFLKRFANCFASHRECSTTAPEVRMYAEMSIRDGECCKFFDVVDKNGDNQVKRLIKLLLFEYQEQSDGYIYYKNKINYRNLHMMIAFINNYNMQYGISSLKKKEQPRINDGVPSVFYHDSVKPKKKVKILPGQLSIFDEDGDN